MSIVVDVHRHGGGDIRRVVAARCGQACQAPGLVGPSLAGRSAVFAINRGAYVLLA